MKGIFSMNFAFLLESSQQTIWPTIIMLVVVVAFFYFFMIRPQKKKDKEDAQMRDSLEIGDEVTTIGGIIGKIVSIKDETFVLETTKDKTKIRFLKGAIRSVDVKAADIAAAILETKEVKAEEPATEGQEPVAEASETDKKKKKRNK